MSEFKNNVNRDNLRRTWMHYAEECQGARVRVRAFKYNDKVRKAVCSLAVRCLKLDKSISPSDKLATTQSYFLFLRAVKRLVEEFADLYGLNCVEWKRLRLVHEHVNAELEKLNPKEGA